MERLHARAYCIGSAGPRREVNDAEAVGAGLHFGEGVSLMYDCFRLRSTSSMVSSFLPSPPKEETKQRRKKEGRRPITPPWKSGRSLPSLNSLPSVAQTSRPLDATDQTSSLRAPGSVQTGGVLHQCWACVAHFQCASPLLSSLFMEGAGLHHGANDVEAFGADFIVIHTRRGRRSSFPLCGDCFALIS